MAGGHQASTGIRHAPQMTQTELLEGLSWLLGASDAHVASR